MQARSKRITSQDAANLAGVSRTTVSFVLNNADGFQISDETRQKVLESAEQLGYVPDSAAQALAGRRARHRPGYDAQSTAHRQRLRKGLIPPLF